MTHPLEARVGGTSEAVNAKWPEERVDGPSLRALLGCYRELQGIVQVRLAQAKTQERRGMLPKPQPLPEAEPLEAKVT